MSSANRLHTATIIAYVPTPHAGYVQLFRHYGGSSLLVLGQGFISEFTSLTRHLPGNDPEDVVAMVRSLGIFSNVRILEPSGISAVLAWPDLYLVMPDEEVSHAVAEKYFPTRNDVHFDSSWRLRWDSQAIKKMTVPENEVQISYDQFDRDLMGMAYASAARSPDWWRQVGAVLARDGKPLLIAFNQHQPSEQSAYCYGDPRSCFEPGVGIDMSLAGHAEVRVIAEAAARGIKTEGCDLYVTTFPCPPCAYACAAAKIRRLYYAEGYSLLAGAEALRRENVELIRVQMTEEPSS